MLFANKLGSLLVVWLGLRSDFPQAFGIAWAGSDGKPWATLKNQLDNRISFPTLKYFEFQNCPALFSVIEKRVKILILWRRF